jgi:predicted Zn-dependent peptidase
MSLSKFKKILLDNGLRVILAPQEHSLATTLLVLVEAGSKYESKEINGISHFLEHMCFKGTEKRPRAIDISSELDAIGAAYNAFTSQEYTGYFAKAESRHWDIIIDLVSDIYINQIFAEEEIDKERGVIIEEINMYEDLPMRRVQDLFVSLLYGDQPAGWDIAGRKEVIQSLNRSDFLDYRKKHYLAQSTVVIVAGKFDEKTVLKDIEKCFVNIRSGEKVDKLPTLEKQSEPRVFVRHKETDQTHLILGARAFHIFDPRKYALEVLSDILGGGMSSRLFQKIREEMGAAYYVRASNDLFSDHGYFETAVGVDHKKIDLVIEVILQEFRNLSKELVSPKELERAKEHLIGGLMLGLETSDALAGFYGGQEIITKELISPEDYAEKIRAVKAEEILSLAQELFQNNKLNLAIIGPFSDTERFKKILFL